MAAAHAIEYVAIDSVEVRIYRLSFRFGLSVYKSCSGDHLPLTIHWIPFRPMASQSQAHLLNWTVKRRSNKTISPRCSGTDAGEKIGSIIVVLLPEISKLTNTNDLLIFELVNTFLIEIYNIFPNCCRRAFIATSGQPHHFESITRIQMDFIWQSTIIDLGIMKYDDL